MESDHPGEKEERRFLPTIYRPMINETKSDFAAPADGHNELVCKEAQYPEEVEYKMLSLMVTEAYCMESVCKIKN